MRLLRSLSTIHGSAGRAGALSCLPATVPTTTELRSAHLSEQWATHQLLSRVGMEMNLACDKACTVLVCRINLYQWFFFSRSRNIRNYRSTVGTDSEAALASFCWVNCINPITAEVCSIGESGREMRELSTNTNLLSFLKQVIKRNPILLEEIRRFCNSLWCNLSQKRRKLS